MGKYKAGYNVVFTNIHTSDSYVLKGFGGLTSKQYFILTLSVP